MTKRLLIILAGLFLAAGILVVSQWWVSEPNRTAEIVITEVRLAGASATGDQLRAMNAAVREATAEIQRRTDIRDRVLIALALLFAVSLILDRLHAWRKGRAHTS